MATRIIKMDAAQGFSAQGAGAAVILAASHFGYPLSTTHVINGGIMGAGAAKRVSAVRWGIAGNIAIAWVLTLPASAAVGRRDLWREQPVRDRVLGPALDQRQPAEPARLDLRSPPGRRARADRGGLRLCSPPSPTRTRS